MYTERDFAITSYVEQFKVATTSTLIQLFFTNYRYGAKRLTELVEREDLKRARCLGDNYDYVYYIKKQPKQLIHNLLLTTFHAKLSRIAKIATFVPEYICGCIRADGFTAYEIDGKKYIAFVEVQTRNFGLDTSKYRQLLYSNDWQQHFPVFPLVIAITDQRIPEVREYRLIRIGLDLDINALR